jgi:hypothetical protein
MVELQQKSSCRSALVSAESLCSYNDGAKYGHTVGLYARGVRECIFANGVQKSSNGKEGGGEGGVISRRLSINGNIFSCHPNLAHMHLRFRLPVLLEQTLQVQPWLGKDERPTHTRWY